MIILMTIMRMVIKKSMIMKVLIIIMMMMMMMTVKITIVVMIMCIGLHMGEHPIMHHDKNDDYYGHGE